ncbi:MAG: iron-sulfur cluster assembly accessory protein [Cyanobacteria bacterium J06606_4]
MIQLTATARRELNRLRQHQNQPNALCRLGLQSSSCAQWTYVLSFESEAADDDEIYDFDGLQLVVKRDRLEFIRDLSIDYAEDLTGGAFRFENPLATESCRCGYAFAIR